MILKYIEFTLHEDRLKSNAKDTTTVVLYPLNLYRLLYTSNRKSNTLYIIDWNRTRIQSLANQTKLWISQEIYFVSNIVIQSYRIVVIYTLTSFFHLMGFEHRVRQQQRRENPLLQTCHRFASTSNTRIRRKVVGKRTTALASALFFSQISTTWFSVAPRHSVAQ